MVKAAVILAGCGYLDGAEIREAVLSLLYLDQQGAEVQCFAPNKSQHHVVNHLTGQPTSEQRNVLTESARIARGKILPLDKLHATEFDALILPGGFGAAKNLSDLAFKGAEASVDPDVQKAILSFLDQQKPIGAICIAPAVLAAAVKGRYRPIVTIGEDAGTAAAIESFGGVHQNCATADFVYDEANRIASCSAYMRDDRLSEIAQGIQKVIAKVVSVAKEQARQRAA